MKTLFKKKKKEIVLKSGCTLALRNTNTSEHMALFYQFHFLLLQPVYSALSHLEGKGSLDDQKARLFPAWWQEVTLHGEFRHLSLPGCRPTGEFYLWEKTPLVHRFSNQRLHLKGEAAWLGGSDTKQFLTAVCVLKRNTPNVHVTAYHVACCGSFFDTPF